MNEGRGAVAGPLHTLLGVGSFAGWTDWQLLERFEKNRDEVGQRAFAALVERHGAGVLRVCRGVLGDSHDAEDAFQATFLVLARKARSIRDRAALGSWLLGVAYRVAGCARSAAARRRAHERKAAGGVATAFTDEEPGDWVPLLHQEIGCLPAKFQTPLVLCYLEGLTQEEVARRLHWRIGTVRSRLARGREHLRRRLVVRGVTPAVATIAVGSAWDAGAVTVPKALVQLTARAAAGAASHSAAVGAVSTTVATLTGEVLKTMIWTKLKINSAVLAAGLLVAGAGVVAGQAGALPGQRATAAEKSRAIAPAAVAQERRPDDPALFILDLDRAKAADYGLTAEDAMQKAVAAAQSLNPTDRKNLWIDPGGGPHLYFVSVPGPDGKRTPIETLLDLPIAVSAPGRSVPLNNLFALRRTSRRALEADVERTEAEAARAEAAARTAQAALKAARDRLSAFDGGPGPPAGDAGRPAIDRQAWARKLAALLDANWRVAFRIGEELAGLPPDEGFAILKANWGKIGNPSARQQILKAWDFLRPDAPGGRFHPRIVDALDLGMRDPSPEVQSWAMGYLGDIALHDFSEDFASYDGWYRANGSLPVAEVVARSARRFSAEAARAGKGDARKRVNWLAMHAGGLNDIPEARRAALDAGLLRTLARWTSGADAGSNAEDIKLATQALRVIGELQPGEAELRRVVVPLLARDRPPDVRNAAVSALDGKENAWATDLVLDVLKGSLETQGPSNRTVIWGAAGALATYGDPRVIPTMIALIDADNTYETVYGVGYFGLGPLTGVQYDESHNGAWWRRWWEKNRQRFPQAVRSLEIPAIPKSAHAREPAPADPLADVADVLAHDVRIGGDEKKRYFLIGAKAPRPPAAGYGLLVVLPGGDGSADFQPFVRRIHKNALNGGWLIAEAVAPKWDERQFQRVVWPTAASQYPAARFTTEEFSRDIIADVRRRENIDPRRVIMLAWSSGGPACYATVLRKDSALTGAFIAMSVFRPEELPPPANARGKPFFLLQSPQDEVTPIRHAEAAEQALKAAGARVLLRRYEGGHGWRGDIWTMIGDGLGWLDQQLRTD
jgi:RNA polymerase sigma factor (sigma-70 family)